MKRTIKLIIIVLIAASNAAIAAPPKKWTLQECIDYAIANNITLQQSRLQKQSAIEDIKQSKAAMLPSLNASTNQSFGYRPWVNTNISTVTNGTVSTSINKTYYNGNYGINANWTVWNGNANVNNIKLSKLKAHQSSLDSAETANSIQEEIAKLYVQILYLNEAINANIQSYEASLKNEKKGIELLELGKMSKADLAQLSAQTAQDKYNVVEAKSNLAKYKLQLKQLLEITDSINFDIAIPISSDESALAEIPALNSIYEIALNTRPEIENGKLAIKSSELSIAIAKAEKLPSISLSGNIGTSTTSMSHNNWDNQIKTNLDASIGATISVPIFDNRSSRTAINKAKLQREQSLLELKEKKKQLYSTIEGYWLDAYTNQQKFKAALISVQSENSSYELLSEQFKLGLKNIIELMTGKANLMNATQNMLQSKYLTVLNQQLLKFYKGEPLNI